MKTKVRVSYKSRIKWKRARGFVAGFSVSTPCGDLFSTRLLWMTSLYTWGGPQGESWFSLGVRVKWWLLLPGCFWSSWRSPIHTLPDTEQGGSAVASWANISGSITAFVLGLSGSWAQLCRLPRGASGREGAASVSFLFSSVSTAEPRQVTIPFFSSYRRYNGFLIDSYISNCFWTRTC